MCSLQRHRSYAVCLQASMIVRERAGSSEITTQAAKYLAYEAWMKTDSASVIAKMNGIEPLIALVGGGSEGAKEQAAKALENLLRTGAT